VYDPGHTHTLYTDRNDNPNYHELGGRKGHLGNEYSRRYDASSYWIEYAGTNIGIYNSGTADAAMDFNVAYVDVIIATRN
jgi:hypothetical protein